MKNLLQLFSSVVMLFMFQHTASAQCQVTTVSMTDGSNSAYTCPQDGNADVVQFANTNTSGSAYAYAITNADYVILAVTTDSEFDFDPAPPGNCLVWGFSYTGDILAEPGESVFSTFFSTGCWNISQNAISVVRETPDGGMVATPTGETSVYVCLDDGIPDFVGFSNNSTSGAAYTYVITDDQNNILGLPGNAFLDFSGAGPGVCRVWGLSYTGNITASVGDNAAAVALSDNCFDLSDNFINVVRNNVDGGTVAMPSGATYREVCSQDGNPDIVMFENTSSSTANYAYAITDENNNILTTTTDSQFDFDGAPAGTCRIWGFSYTGAITASAGQSVFTQLSEGCFQISSNAITVRRVGVDGGTVAMPSGATVRYTCPGDGMDDIVMFTHQTNTPDVNYAYVITDDQNNILGLPPGNSQNFEGAGVGVCRVWGLAYTGSITAGMGDNAAMVDLSDGCFDLSDNFIEIVRDTPEGGTVATADGATSIEICAGDGVDDAIDFSHMTSSMAAYRYVVTDDQNIILGLPPGNTVNFEGAGSGVCRVWGLSYTGAITAEVGDDAAAVALANSCFELSSNFVTVIRTGVDGGEVTTIDGATSAYTCPGDGVDDVIQFAVTTSEPSANQQIVVTDNQLNVLGLPPGNEVNFEGAGVGECWVWNLSYTGTLNLQMGDNVADVPALSDGCFSLSDAFVTVTRDNPDGGTVSTAAGETTIELCAGDGIADMYEFAHVTSSTTAYRYVVTDDQNNILGLPPGNTVNFEGAGSGVCRVWGLSYTGAITAEVGDNAAMVDLANSCFELSQNFVTVIRTGVDGGEVTTIDGATSAYTCPGDGIDDVIEFTVTTSEPDANQQIVVTDDQLNVLGLPPGNTVNFEGAGVGECWVWHLSYTGNLNLQMGDNVADVPALSDACFSLSDAFVTVNRDEPDGGMVTTVAGETSVTTIAGDGIDDIIEFAHTGASNSLFTYVITDDQNNILGIPPGNSQNFEGAGAGICRVWGLAYTGEIIAASGDNAAAVNLTDGCFDLSDNFIEVIRMDGLTGGGISVTLSPNPTPNVLFVDMDLEEKATAETTQVSVYHLSGQLMHQQKFATHDGQNRFRLDLNHLEEGYYKVAVQNGQAFEQTSFVKQ